MNLKLSSLTKFLGVVVVQQVKNYSIKKKKKSQKLNGSVVINYLKMVSCFLFVR